MSLLSNANITRYGIINSWSSNWVESNILYSSIIYTDIYINELINGIYYKLKMPNALPIIKNLGYQKTLMFVNSFIFHKETRFYKWRNYYRDLFYVKYLRRKILFGINRICKYILYYNSDNYAYNINCFLQLSNLCINKLTHYIKKKKLNIFYYNKHIKSKYYKKLNSYIFKYIRKNKYSNKKFKLYKYSKKNKYNYGKYNKKNKLLNSKKYNKKSKLINNKTKLYYKKKYNLNNRLYYFNNINSINNYKYYNKKISGIKYIINKIKMSLINKYKTKINNFINNKYKTNSINIHLKNKISRMHNIKINTLNKRYNNLNYIIYYLLVFKVTMIYTYIYMYVLIYSILVKNIYKKKMYLVIKNNINNIKSINSINSIKIDIIYTFNNLFLSRIKKINIIKKNKKYSRIRSQYRLKKKTERLNKEKKYNMFRRIILYQHYFNFVCNTPKYITKINKELIYKQLCLKVNDTINLYLNYNVYYLHNNNEMYFNRIDNPKLLSDYIKILMKYEEKNPNILKKIVKIHSKQNYKSKVFTRKYIKKSHTFIKKINNKLNLQNNNNNINIYHKVINRTQQIKMLSTIKNSKYIKKQNNNTIMCIYKNNNSINNINKNNKLKELNTNKINNKKKINLYKINNNNLFLINSKLLYCQYLYKWLLNMKLLKYKKYPLIGMRIELNGPTKKGRRTQTHLYNEWVDFYTLPGKMQLVKIINDIKYWQSYGLTQRASIGIKVWMHFHTARYSELRKNIIE